MAMDKVYALSLLLTVLLSFNPGGRASIGINYGGGHNLPSPRRTISKLHEINMKKIRILQPREDVLKALHKSGISVMVGAPSRDVASLSAAKKWVHTHILPHRSHLKFTCISVGSHMLTKIPSNNTLTAMHHLHSALRAANLSIPVTTSVSMQILSTPHPPSAAVFSRQAHQIITNITTFLQSNKFPLLVEVHPFFARQMDPQHVDLNYTLFKHGRTVVHDGPYTYWNMFDAMIDAVHVALQKIGRSTVKIVVSETGWPTKWGRDASVKNARTYVNNLIKHVSSGQGTPRIPRKEIDAYISSMFDRTWGLFYPNLTQVYQVSFPKKEQIHHLDGAVGINYGLLGDNLPSPSRTISRIQKIGVRKIRVFQPDKEDKDVLRALHNSGVSVIVSSYNEDLRSLASNKSVAAAWVKRNILPHKPHVKFTCIALGNEVYPGEDAQYLGAAMKNMRAALVAAKLSIPVSTAVSMQVLSSSYPPSSGAFSDPHMTEIARFLEAHKYPLLVNVYPYFAHLGDPKNVGSDYALFKGKRPAVRDGGKAYLNLFDAMTDAVYAALEKVGARNVEIIVSETGWPSGGGIDASVKNAGTYVKNLIKHVSSGEGTPRRPGKKIKTYIFAMYNENRKAAGVEQNWGLYYPNLTRVYHVDHF